MAAKKKTRRPLDPDAETPRKYLANITTRMVHGTESEDPACAPAPTDTVGWGDEVTPFFGRRFFACPICRPQVEDAERNAAKARLRELTSEANRLQAVAGTEV
jgi:hypothetical protein